MAYVFLHSKLSRSVYFGCYSLSNVHFLFSSCEMYAKNGNSSNTFKVPCQSWNFDDSIYSETLVTKVSAGCNAYSVDYST